MTAYCLTVRQVEQVCLFDLTWGQGQRLTATLPYPREILQRYGDWQRAYLGYYDHQLRGRAAVGGTLTALPVNWHGQLVQAEALLLSEFHRWLRREPLHEIWETLAGRRSLLDPRLSGTDVTEIFLTCEPLELARLPWETWEVGTALGTTQRVRMARSPLNIREQPLPRHRFRKGKARILVILGDDTGLNFETERKALRSLRGLAEVVFLGWQPKADTLALRTQICQAIADPRGWDVLFFAGHSNEARAVGGTIAIAPDTHLSMRELSPYLSQAQQRGLQFALFNSCSGLDLAESLIGLGLSQVAIMREPIHNQVAEGFLVQFLQGLSQGLDAHDALIQTCHSLKLDQQLTYPSVSLVPSMFRHPASQLQPLKPFGLGDRLKQMLPTRREAIALSALVGLSLVPAVSGWLLEQRVRVQALSHQAFGAPPAAEPPVLLVQIDDLSLQKAGFSSPKPMRRRYLADLVDQLVAYDARVIGLDYLLDLPQEDDPALRWSLENAIARNDTRFVFAAHRNHGGEWLSVHPDVAEPEMGVRGDVWVPFWSVLPLRTTRQRPQPFGYQLAIAHLRSTAAERDPNSLSDRQLLPAQRAQLSPITALSYPLRQRWLQPILDFSLPPEQIYHSVRAWQLLEEPETVLGAGRSLENAIVIIAAGGYVGAGLSAQDEDNFPMPAAIAHWRHQSETPTRGMTGGEAHAYMAHHFLRQHFVIPVPDVWMVLLVAGVGKAIALYGLPRWGHRSAWVVGAFGGAIAGYGGVSLWLYGAAGVLLPWVFPVLTLGFYLLPIDWEKNHA